MKLEKQLKLNLGCGSEKIKGYINIDGERIIKPDLVLDIKSHVLPYKQNSVNEVLMFHTIEHIEKRLHPKILLEISRVLKPQAKLYLSYPNFWECAKRWRISSGSQRSWWEATLYGRQLYKGDYHVCIINSDELTLLLYECGFKDVVSFPEPEEIFNTVTIAIKGSNSIPLTYENMIAKYMQSVVVKGNK